MSSPNFSIYIFSSHRNVYERIMIVTSEGLTNLVIADCLKKHYEQIYSMRGSGPAKFSTADGLKLEQIF